MKYGRRPPRVPHLAQIQAHHHRASPACRLVTRLVYPPPSRQVSHQATTPALFLAPSQAHLQA